MGEFRGVHFLSMLFFFFNLHVIFKITKVTENPGNKELLVPHVVSINNITKIADDLFLSFLRTSIRFSFYSAMCWGNAFLL